MWFAGPWLTGQKSFPEGSLVTGRTAAELQEAACRNIRVSLSARHQGAGTGLFSAIPEAVTLVRLKKPSPLSSDGTSTCIGVAWGYIKIRIPKLSADSTRYFREPITAAYPGYDVVVTMATPLAAQTVRWVIIRMEKRILRSIRILSRTVSGQEQRGWINKITAQTTAQALQRLMQLPVFAAPRVCSASSPTITSSATVARVENIAPCPCQPCGMIPGWWWYTLSRRSSSLQWRQPNGMIKSAPLTVRNRWAAHARQPSTVRLTISRSECGAPQARPSAVRWSLNT